MEGNPLGKPIFLLRRVAGMAAGHKVVRSFPNGNDQLCRELGKQLASTVLEDLKQDGPVDSHDSSTNGLINAFKRMNSDEASGV